jgi:hypothetical protein
MLRQLKMLVFVLVISNIALGAFAYSFLRTIDQKYSDLIDQSVPTLNGLQILTRAASETMRSTNPVLLSESNVSPAGLAGDARNAIEHDKALRQELLRREWVSSAKSERADVRETGEVFSRAAVTIVPLLEANNAAEANRQREAILRPAFNRYVAATLKASDLLDESSLETSKHLSVRTGNLSKLVLGLGSWPVVILGALLLFTALFVVTVLLRVALFKEEPA